MFKKFLSLALVLMLVMGMAAIAASAAQVEISENAADTPAAVGAEGAADTGADGGAETGADSKIYFDTNGTGWNNFDLIAFHIWAIDDDSFTGFDWGGKKENGTDEGNGIWSYDIASKIAPLQDGKQYCVIFYSKIGGSAAMQTYNLLMGTPCLGKTAACDGTTYENPEDSNKTALAAFWGGVDAATYGPELKITSIGNVVGTCCAASTSPYAMFVDFLTNTLPNARTFSGKDDQKLLDDTAAALGLGQDLIKKAIAETGADVKWEEAKSEAPSESDPEATQKGDGTQDPEAPATDGDSKDSSKDSSDSSKSSSNSSSSSNGGSSSSSSGSSASGSGSASQTGQETTVLYIMLGVMVVAAGVIFFARKKTRA